MKRLLIFWALIFGTAGCGDSEPDPIGPIPSMLITNRSQYTLNELRIHAASNYLDTANMLPEPMAIEEQVMFYGVGPRWFTVLRERSELGKVLAFTTAEPVEMFRNTGYKLLIFDEAFRVEPDEYQRPDEFMGAILGDPGPECTWAKTSTCSVN
jgi:hypothetical protein